MIDDYAGIDGLYKEFSRIYEADPEQSEAINEAFEGTHAYTKTSTFFRDAQLSYTPEKPEGVSEDEPLFRFWAFNYARKGKMNDLKEVMKEWVDLAKEKGAKQGWDTFIYDMGEETPALFWVASGKDAVDFFAANAADMDLLGEEADKLWQKHVKCLRKVEDRTGWYRKDLSFIPGE